MVVVLAAVIVWSILCWRGTPPRDAAWYVLRVTGCLLAVGAVGWAVGLT